MGNKYESFGSMRDDDMQGGGFILGLLAGAVIGTGLGLLFAPKAGSALRSDLSSSASDLAASASRQYKRASDAASQYAEKGREMYTKGRDAMNRGMREGYEANTASEIDDAAAGFTSGMNATEGPRS